MKRQFAILAFLLFFFFCFTSSVLFLKSDSAFPLKTDYELLNVQFDYDGYNLIIKVCNPEDKVLAFDDPLYLEGVVRTYQLFGPPGHFGSATVKSEQGLPEGLQRLSLDPLKKAFDGTDQEAFGISIKTQFKDEDTIHLDDSPFHGEGDFEYGRYKVEMKPKSCGTRMIPINIKLEEYEKIEHRVKDLDRFQIIFTLKDFASKNDRVFNSQWFQYKIVE
jgi:hypothetical protein